MKMALLRNKETTLPIDETTGSVDTARIEAENEAKRQPPGHRHPHISAPRPSGPAAYKAILTRGVTFRYVGGSVFEKGRPVPISEDEFQHLSAMADSVVYFDGERRIRRFMRKFRFETLDGEPLDLDPIPDQQLDALSDDPFEAAERARQIAG
jgi:hypothetical protein